LNFRILAINTRYCLARCAPTYQSHRRPHPCTRDTRLQKCRTHPTRTESPAITITLTSTKIRPDCHHTPMMTSQPDAEYIQLVINCTVSGASLVH